MSIRMALGFRPSDLRGDRHLKREPCTKTYKTQRIITVRYDDLYPLTNSYKVMDAIDPYDGSDTFDDIPEESLSPVDLCPFELDHPDWTIKGLVCPSSTKGEFMAAAITDVCITR